MLGRIRRSLRKLVLSTVLVVAAAARAQDQATPPAGAEGASTTSWEVRAAIAAYFLEHQSSYLQPTVAIDHGGLHLEGRYNYEAQRTGSLWVGWTWEWGDKLKLYLTPMLGGVFGEVNGIAPGLEWDLSWDRLELYSEDEFVFDLANWSGSDFYSWAELSGRPVAWFRVGIALQRTRAVATERVVEWGPFVGLEVWKLSAGAYWFDPGQAGSQYWVASIAARF